jgi:hypothetical protein
MNDPQSGYAPWLKPACWGVVGGAVGIMIIGFAWRVWVLGSTAERLAKARADGAVTAVLVPICVARCMGQADAAAKLADGQHRPEWGGGTGLRPTAREPRDLASSTIRRATQALDHRPCP